MRNLDYEITAADLKYASLDSSTKLSKAWVLEEERMHQTDCKMLVEMLKTITYRSDA